MLTIRAPRFSLATRGPLPVALVAAVGAAVLTGCSRPRFEGPQIQEPPPGFIYDANSTQARNVFPEREQLWQGAWWRMDSGADTHSSLFLTAYRGSATRDQVQAARDAQESRWGRPGQTEYGGLELLRIDGRTAWGWTESQYRRDGSVAALEFKAVVPYDTVTYALEFHTDQPEWMKMDTLRATVLSFGVGQTRVNWFAVIGSVIVALLVAGWVRTKVRELAEPVKVPEPPPPPEDAPRDPGQLPGDSSGGGEAGSS